MLGTIGQLGVFFGLPVDIRHITFSSANFAFALVGLDHQISWQLALYSLLGILLIGIVNLGVSFSLAMLVALRSRRVSFGRGSTLVHLLWRRFRSGGRDFSFPAKSNTRKIKRQNNAISNIKASRLGLLLIQLKYPARSSYPPS
jgi:site-specific recombinase